MSFSWGGSVPKPPFSTWPQLKSLQFAQVYQSLGISTVNVVWNLAWSIIIYPIIYQTFTWTHVFLVDGYGRNTCNNPKRKTALSLCMGYMSYILFNTFHPHYSIRSRSQRLSVSFQMFSGKVLFWESNIFSELFVIWRLLGHEITRLKAIFFQLNILPPPYLHDIHQILISLWFSLHLKQEKTHSSNESLPKCRFHVIPLSHSPNWAQHPWLWSGEGGTVRPFRTKASISWVISWIVNWCGENWCYTGTGKTPQKMVGKEKFNEIYHIDGKNVVYQILDGSSLLSECNWTPLFSGPERLRWLQKGHSNPSLFKWPLSFETRIECTTTRSLVLSNRGLTAKFPNKIMSGQIIVFHQPR